MLSEENRLKLQMTGVYKHEPDVKLRGTLYSQSLYHCCNWTFKPREHDDGSIYMIDTYWSSGGFYIELTDENFDEFEFIVDLNDIKLFTEVSNKLGDYASSDIYRLALDSSGVPGRLYIRKDAHKIKENVIQRLEEEIESAKDLLARKQANLKRVLDGTCNIDYM
jgi:hypothetical protein|nr:MAG TPA: hypothetical protein [Bacteriophage sp.]